MSHNIARIGGEDAFASARVPAWHRLGTVVPKAMTAKDALIQSHLDYHVSLRGLHLSGDDVHIPAKATVRYEHGKPVVLGVVGERYRVIQNEDAFAVLDAIVDQSGAHFETAGALGNGERVFMSMKLPEGIRVAGQDQHDVYLLATNSHDGTSAFTVAVTPLRVVCQNTLTMALRGAKQKFTLRHTESAQGRIQEAREALQLTFEYLTDFELELSRMLDRRMGGDQFLSVVQELIPVNEESKPGWKERALRERRQLMDLFLEAETNEFGRGTRYAAYNAIAEYADWYLPLKGGDIEGIRRAERAMSRPTVQSFKDRGLALLRV